MPARCVVLRVRCPWPLGSCSPVCPLGVLCCVCVVLGHLAPVHRCARSMCCVPCAVSGATWVLSTGVSARCVASLVRCSRPLGSCSPVCPLGVSCCVCSVLGHLASVHRCARLMCCVVCAVSWATWLLFTGVSARCIALRVRCPGPLGYCSPVCLRGLLCCVCGVLDHLAPVHPCARSVRCFVGAVSWATWLLFTRVSARCVVLRSAVSWATWLLFTGVPARCVVLRVRCPGPLGSCPPVCPTGALLCWCGVLGHLAPVHRCARVVCCVACAVSWATWLLFTGAPGRWVALLVRCPEPLGSCSPLCTLGVLCCSCGVLGHLAPVHWCVRSVRCFACAVSWANWLLFTGVAARCVALLVRYLGPLGSCSPVCPRGLLCCNCGVLGHLAPVHRLLARCVAVLVRCPGPLGSCSPVCPLGVLCCVCGVLGHLGPVHRCARSLCYVARALSWATWHLFTGVPARCVLLRVRCPGPLESCPPVCPTGALLCSCGVPGHLAPVHRCASVVCCVACAVSWATWLLFTGAPARCVALLVQCPGPLGSSSPVCTLGVLCCVCGVLGHLAPVHRCVRSVRCFACAVSWATWLLFTGVAARCVALRVRCPGPLGYCSPVCPRGLLCCVCGVRGHLALVHRCARSVRCFVGAVSWATWLLFTGVPARCVVLRLRCPGPLGSCSPVCPLGALLCVCDFLGHLAPVHRCARSVCCVACAVSLATWLLFTIVPALCVLCCACGVVGPWAPVHRCARSVCCVAWAVSWATWLLFTAVLARCAVLGVQCPGPLGSCSPVCSLGVLCCRLRAGGVAAGRSLVYRDGGCSQPAGAGFAAWRALVHPDGGCL